MRYVVDSSVAIKWVLAEVHSDKAEWLRDQFTQGIHNLFSPEVFHIEVAHSLTRAERQGRIAVGDAEILWNEVMADSPVLVPSLPLMDKAIQIASAARIGVYDCLYVALADREGCEFVTADDKLVKKLRKQYPFITPLSSLS